MAYKLAATLTGVGGHFLNGDRKRGYGFLLFLLTWPFLYIAVCIGGTVLLQRELSPTVEITIFAIGFIAIWMASARSAVKRREEGPEGGRKPVLIELVVATLVLYVATACFALFYIWLPQLKPGEQISLFTVSSRATATSPKLMPASDGDVVLVCTVYNKDRRVEATKIVLQFRNGFRTAPLVTNSKGEFEYRLPAGQWRFIGPLVSGFESKPVYVMFNDPLITPEFSVNSGAPAKRVEMRIVVE